MNPAAPVSTAPNTVPFGPPPPPGGVPSGTPSFNVEEGKRYQVLFQTADGSPMTDATVAAIQGIGWQLVEAGGSSGLFTAVATSDKVLPGSPHSTGAQPVIILQVEPV